MQIQISNGHTQKIIKTKTCGGALRTNSLGIPIAAWNFVSFLRVGF